MAIEIVDFPSKLWWFSSSQTVNVRGIPIINHHNEPWLSSIHHPFTTIFTIRKTILPGKSRQDLTKVAARDPKMENPPGDPTNWGIFSWEDGNMLGPVEPFFANPGRFFVLFLIFLDTILINNIHCILTLLDFSSRPYSWSLSIVSIGSLSSF